MARLDEIDLQDILFIDIETVSQYPDLDEAPGRLQSLWKKKARNLSGDEEPADELYPRAAIYAEFGKIICISVGIVTGKEEHYGLRIKSYAGDEERVLLEEFTQMLIKYSKERNVYLCAHNGKEFDFPYLARRMLIQGLRLPEVLDLSGRKPWEVKHLDTMELWKFGDYKHYTSLELLTEIFGIPSPKGDIDGSLVGAVYWKEKDLPRIVNYCQEDVIAVAQLLMRYRSLPLIPETAIEIIS